MAGTCLSPCTDLGMWGSGDLGSQVRECWNRSPNLITWWALLEWEQGLVTNRLPAKCFKKKPLTGQVQLRSFSWDGCLLSDGMTLLGWGTTSEKVAASGMGARSIDSLTASSFPPVFLDGVWRGCLGC